MPTPDELAVELGFRSVETEVSDRTLPVEGSVPAWLSGALVRNGPGTFAFGDERATHWFDGLAMLRRYAFADGAVEYTNRFLRTEAYERAQRGETAGEFATGGGLRQTIAWLRSLGPPESTDNANVHVARLGDHYVALTEAPRRVAFDPVTLETRGEFRWTDDLTEHLTTAHLTVDAGGETVGFATEFGRSPRYHVYRVPRGEEARERVGTVPAEGPGYVHDCAVTADHVVLVETPLRIAVFRVLLPWTDGLFDALEYDGDRRTRFVVLDRDTGEVVCEPRTDPFFTFHHVNAFERDGDLVVDLVAFEDDSIVEALTLDALSEGAFAGSPDGRLVRFRIDLDLDLDPDLDRADGSGSATASGGDHAGVAVERSRRYAGGLELPTVPPAVRGRPYRYLYAQATDRRHATGLVKVDVESGAATEWWERGVYVEEPRAVRRPDADREDAGVVLAPALDTGAGRTVLLVFDAGTLTERARVPLPHAVPFGFHGRFFPDATR